ncbi:MAG: pyridoxamine 5'-phosphate oxidase [Nitrospirae bacterium GWD2_57_9]|nr:MAG: pyridoxamine 5'-phosphate oxidase [Nitrospirae bacterium GWD2_57_9]OGW50522.1 MAG: pyridoxamine 5'-phosphate oxidase [Nitrospirae bacterium GWC2_57_9]
MNKNEILQFLNANMVFHLATVEDGEPRVRGIWLYRADENGLVFHTGKMKELHRQLSADPHVEMSFNNGKFGDLTQVRVRGTVELVEDLELKKEIVQKRPFLKPWVDQDGYEQMAVYRLKNGKAAVWSMSDNLAPKEFVEL